MWLSDKLLHSPENQDAITTLDNIFLQKLENTLQQYDYILENNENLTDEVRENILQDLLSYFIKNKTIEISIEKEKEILDLYTRQQTQQLKEEIENSIPNTAPSNPKITTNIEKFQTDESVVYQKIKWTSLEESIKRNLDTTIEVEERCRQIEFTFFKYIYWSVNPELQAILDTNTELRTSMKWGLAYYFINEYTTLSKTDKQQIAWIWSTLWWINWFIDIIKNLTSFHSQFQAISTLTEGIDIYTNELLSEGENSITNLPAFQSPEKFVVLLQKHTHSLQENLQTKQAKKEWKKSEFWSFDEYFALEIGQDVNLDSIIENFNYDKETHQFMEKFVGFWGEVFEQKDKLSQFFSNAYTWANEIASLFWKSVYDYIEWTWRERPLDFVASILGYGSFKYYSYRHNWFQPNKEVIKQSTTKMDSIDETISYLESNRSSLISPEISDLLYSIPNEKYKEYTLDKSKALNVLPNIDSLKNAIIHTLEWFENSFYIDPHYLAGIGNYTREYYFEKYYILDHNNNYQLNEENLSEYNKFIKNNLDTIVNKARLWKNGLLVNTDSILWMIKDWKEKWDFEQYLITSLSFPAIDDADSSKSSNKNQEQWSTINDNSSDWINQNKKENDKKDNKEIAKIEKEGIVESTQKQEQKEDLNFFWYREKDIESLWIEERAREAYDYLLFLWYDHIQATAIVANIHVESNFDYTNKSGDSWTAHGLCQRRGERFDNLVKFSQEYWRNRTDFYLQLNFIQYEQSWRTPWYYDRFMNSDNVETATELFDKWYERSDGTHRQRRIDYALKYNSIFESFV